MDNFLSKSDKRIYIVVMKNADTNSISTVSMDFIGDWLKALDGYCSAQQMEQFLRDAELDGSRGNRSSRVTLDQIVRLYQSSAINTGDEMMGLWSRPIRAGALKHLLTTVRASSSLPSALYRFASFWNMLLDDFQFALHSHDGLLSLKLVPQSSCKVQRFGHMLILKLSHGLLSWLAGYEVPVLRVEFVFHRPSFAQDYPVIYPAPVHFDAPNSAIFFEQHKLGPPQVRSDADLLNFLYRAPRDWVFTSYHEHTLSLQIRDIIYRSQRGDCTLVDAAEALQLTPRTLIRRLKQDDTSFQAIKDGFRRDLAIRELQAGHKNIEEISQEVGFSSAANFHRAFKKWTGVTPGAYR